MRSWMPSCVMPTSIIMTVSIRKRRLRMTMVQVPVSLAATTATLLPPLSLCIVSSALLASARLSSVVVSGTMIIATGEQGRGRGGGTGGL